MQTTLKHYQLHFALGLIYVLRPMASSMRGYNMFHMIRLPHILKRVCTVLITLSTPSVNAIDAHTAIQAVKYAVDNRSVENVNSASTSLAQLDLDEWEDFRRGIRELNTQFTDLLERATLTRVLARGLEGEQAVLVLTNDVLDLNDPFERYLLAWSFERASGADAEPFSEEKSNAVISIMEDLLELTLSLRGETGLWDHPAQDTVQGIIKTLSKCGEAGSAILREMDDFESWRFSALALTGSNSNMQYLLDQSRYATRGHVRFEATKYVAQFLNNYDDSDREDFLADILALAASPDSADRRQAIYIAGFTSAPELLPSLEAIAQSDPHVETRTRNGLQEQYHPLRVNAENAIHEIKRRTDPIYRRIVRLTESVANAQQDIQRYQQNLAAGIDPETTQMRLRSAQERLERYQTELAELEAQQP